MPLALKVTDHIRLVFWRDLDAYMSAALYTDLE